VSPNPLGRSHEAQRELVIKKLTELQAQKFYGRVTMSLSSGNIVQALIERSWKVKEEADGISSKEAQALDRQDQKEAARPKHEDQTQQGSA